MPRIRWRFHPSGGSNWRTHGMMRTPLQLSQQAAATNWTNAYVVGGSFDKASEIAWLSWNIPSLPSIWPSGNEVARGLRWRCGFKSYRNDIGDDTSGSSLSTHDVSLTTLSHAASDADTKQGVWNITTTPYTLADWYTNAAQKPTFWIKTDEAPTRQVYVNSWRNSNRRTYLGVSATHAANMASDGPLLIQGGDFNTGSAFGTGEAVHFTVDAEWDEVESNPAAPQVRQITSVHQAAGPLVPNASVSLSGLQVGDLAVIVHAHATGTQYDNTPSAFPGAPPAGWISHGDVYEQEYLTGALYTKIIEQTDLTAGSVSIPLWTDGTDTTEQEVFLLGISNPTAWHVDWWDGVDGAADWNGPRELMRQPNADATTFIVCRSGETINAATTLEHSGTHMDVRSYDRGVAGDWSPQAVLGNSISRVFAVTIPGVNVGPVIPSGTGSLSASTSMSGSGYAVHFGSGDISAATALSGDGQTVRQGSGSIAATVALTGSGGLPLQVGSGGGDISATSSMSGSGQAVYQGSGSITATSALSGNGQTVRQGSGSITAAASLAGDGQTVRQGSGSLSATVALTGSGEIPSQVGSGGGDISASTSMSGSGQAVYAGSGSLTAVSSISGNGLTVRQGGGSISATASLTGSGSAEAPAASGGGDISVSVAMAGSGEAIYFGGGSLEATTTLDGDGQTVRQGGGSISAATTLTGSGSAEAPAASGGGDISVSVSMSGSGQAVYAGGGSLTASVTLTGTGAPVSGEGSGSGSIAATVTLVGSGSAVYFGSGDISVAAVLVGSGQTIRQGSGDLVAVGAMSGSGSNPAALTGSLVWNGASWVKPTIWDGTQWIPMEAWNGVEYL